MYNKNCIRAWLRTVRFKGSPPAGRTQKPTFDSQTSSFKSQRFPQETRISTLNLCRNFLDIRLDSSDVIVCLAFLSRNVGAHIPAVHLRKQRGSNQFIDMFLERQRSMCCRRKLGDMVLAQVRNRLDDPSSLKLQTGRSIAERRRSMWTVREEQIRKVVNRQAETAHIRIQMVGPMIRNGWYLVLTRSSRRPSSGLE